MLLYVGM